MAREQPFEIVTFDCYGTLIDWESGIAEAFLAEASAQGAALERRRVLAAYAETEPEVEAGSFVDYREVLAETARRVAARLGWRLPPGRAGFLAESLPRWVPFPDTVPALERISGAGYRLGVLSNVDDDLLHGTCRHLPVPFDLVITARQVRSYKPSPAHFLAARRRIAPARWLHAAQSFFHDIQPAMELGVEVAWINRKGEPTPPEFPRPTREMRTLADLASWLAPSGSGGEAP